MTHSSVASSAQVSRKANKPKPGTPVRMQIIFPAELVDLVDAFAVEMTKEAPFERPKTRTDAMKRLVTESLKKHGLLK